MKSESLETSEPGEGVGFGVKGEEAAAFQFQGRGDVDDVVGVHSSPAMMRLKRSASHSPGFGGTKPASIMRCNRSALTRAKSSPICFWVRAFFPVFFGAMVKTSPERVFTSARPYFRTAARILAGWRFRSLRVKVTGGLMSNTGCLTLVRDQADN